MQTLALAVGAFVAVGFVGAPLLRDEAELEPLRPPLAAEEATHSDDEDSAVEYGPLPVDGGVRCGNCGSVSEGTYSYCGQCLTALP
ncbi:DUF7577 domain-containing protein [Halovenus halobia]|uniref:DUF7577 domain-containing protein n=1 Tax=Halovenus halobia TaxID=3396622 RepID=UPI003F5493E6